MVSAGAAAMAKETAVESLMSDDTEETGMAEAVGAACAVSPSVTPTPASGEGCVASVPTVDVAAAVASPATLRRMYERKEDMLTEAVCHSDVCTVTVVAGKHTKPPPPHHEITIH